LCRRWVEPRRKAFGGQRQGQQQRRKPAHTFIPRREFAYPQHLFLFTQLTLLSPITFLTFSQANITHGLILGRIVTLR
jgi:hypothetical protein